MSKSRDTFLSQPMLQVPAWIMIQDRVMRPVHTMQMLPEKVTDENLEYSLTIYTQQQSIKWDHTFTYL